jgi:uncharacterized damage-inducible protein DinB
MSISQALLPEFDHEMNTCRTMLDRIPDDKFGWKPHAKSMTMGDLATHIATIGHWADAIMGMDAFDVTSAPPTPKFTKRADLLKGFDESVAHARKVLAAASDADYMKMWTLKSGDKAVFSMPKAAVVRTFVMNHTVHHRGQLSVYLRLNDVSVPSIYGPSADEGQM